MTTKFKEYFQKSLTEKQGESGSVYFSWGDKQGEAFVVTVTTEKPKKHNPDRYIKVDKTDDGKKIGSSDYIVFGWRLENGTVCGVGKTKEEAVEDFYNFMQDDDNHLTNYDADYDPDYPFEKKFSYSKVTKWIKKQIVDRDFSAAYCLLNMADLPGSFKAGYSC